MGRRNKHTKLSARDIELLLTDYAALSNIEIARVFKASPKHVSDVRLAIDAIRLQAIRDEAEDHKRMMVAFSPGCYYEYGYAPENLSGWERKTLLEGPKHSLFKREKGL